MFHRENSQRQAGKVGCHHVYRWIIYIHHCAFINAAMFPPGLPGGRFAYGSVILQFLR